MVEQRIFELGFAVGADVAVGVVRFGQKQKMQRFVVFQLWQCVFEGAPGGFAAGPVAIEAELNAVGLAHQELDVVGGGGGA